VKRFPPGNLVTHGRDCGHKKLDGTVECFRLHGQESYAALVARDIDNRFEVGYIKDITLERIAAFEENDGLEDKVFWLFALRGKSSDLGVYVQHALIPCHPAKILDALRVAGIYPKLLSKESSFGRAVG